MPEPLRQVLPAPVPRMGWLRRLLSFLPGFCGYCGYRYVPSWTSHYAVPAAGKSCPSGHEGYVDAFSLAGRVRCYEYDYVQHPPKPIETSKDSKDSK